MAENNDENQTVPVPGPSTCDTLQDHFQCIINLLENSQV